MRLLDIEGQDACSDPVSLRSLAISEASYHVQKSLKRHDAVI